MTDGGAGWQLTTVLQRLHRLHRLVPGPGPYAGRGAAPAGEPDATAPSDLREVAADRLRAGLTASERSRYDTLLGGGDGDGRGGAHPDGPGDPDRHTVLRRALAATGSVDTVAALAGRWSTLGPVARTAVLDPVTGLGRAGRQSDGTTCGSAVLVMLAAAGDPLLALWLATGLLPGGVRPPELAGAPPSRLVDLAEGPPRRRFAPIQRVVKNRTNARGPLGPPWPAALGTPPWGAAREARFAGLAFGHRLLDDTDPVHLGEVLDRVEAAVLRGVPVPLYAGGDTARGWGTALPRHVVLAVGRTAEGLAVWEPSVGRVLPVTRAALLAGGVPHPALGGWSHLVWAVLPR